jgi:hypothetical protein
MDARNIAPGDTVRITDETVTITVTQVHPEGIAGYDDRMAWRAIRWDRVKAPKGGRR